MKVFLDCGGWNGYSVRVFRQLYDPHSEYFIFSFEANPIHHKHFLGIDKHVFYGDAVWIEDVEKEFFIDRTKKKASSSLIKEKITGNLDKENPIIVRCVDIDRWIKEHIVKQDEVVLKLDIEGAEYSVLPHMIKNGSIDYIDRLFIEWHWNKVGISQRVHNDLVKQIKDIGIPITERWKVGYKK